MDGDVARIQRDFMFVGAEGTFVDEPRAKATVLMRTKTDEYGVEMVLRFLSTYEDEPSIVEIARRVQPRRDKTTTLAQTSVEGHQEIGAVERANGTVQAQLRAYHLDVQERMKVRGQRRCQDKKQLEMIPCQAVRMIICDNRQQGQK